MDEKTIYELRLIKTPTGFQVEVNGHKEQMRELALARKARRDARQAARRARHCREYRKHVGPAPETL